MKLRAVIHVSQDGRNWTLLALDPPIPRALLDDWAFVRPALIAIREDADEVIEGAITPAPPRDPKFGKHTHA